MRRLISVIFILAFCFTGCSKEDIIKYDLVLYDDSLSAVGEYLNSFENEHFVAEEFDFETADIAEYFAAGEELEDKVNSITLYSNVISDDAANSVINFAENINVPVIFSIADINEDILNSYDKAFSIKTDYSHAAEITAEKITDCWKENDIIDSDENLIFKFAVVKDENLSDDMQDFHDTLIADIELYGIPMQLSETVFAEDISSAEALEELKSENEGIIVISDSVLAYVEDYSSEGDGIEIIVITNNTKNDFSSDSSVLNCFVDYTLYKNAADELLSNYNSREYLLSDFSFPYIDKTIYISATV